MKLVAVVCFRDEEGTLPETLSTIAAQTRPPDELLLLDDGSVDGSAAVADEFARAHGYVRVLRRPPRARERDRLARGSVVEAFEWALGHAGDVWDVAAKLDADLRFTPATFATVMSALELDASLGIAGPRLEELGASGEAAPTPSRTEHVEGATKFYRRACFEQIAPLPRFLGWDVVDEVRARLRGWRTESLPIPGGNPVHLRPMGSVDGMLRAYRRWGECAWAYGEHPLHVVLLAAKGLGRPPRVRGGLAYVAGWAAAGLRRAPRAEPEVLEWMRHDQLRRIRGRLRRLGHRAEAPSS